jgi:hypothetical protein
VQCPAAPARGPRQAALRRIDAATARPTADRASVMARLLEQVLRDGEPGA